MRATTIGWVVDQRSSKCNDGNELIIIEADSCIHPYLLYKCINWVDLIAFMTRIDMKVEKEENREGAGLALTSHELDMTRTSSSNPLTKSSASAIIGKTMMWFTGLLSRSKTSKRQFGIFVSALAVRFNHNVCYRSYSHLLDLTNSF